jgi:hypothetical protein
VICDVVAEAGTVELCDGLDNDCDGSIDEDFITLGDNCSVGSGQCAASGSYICAGDGSGVICDVVAAAGTVEVCDGLDNDCDGVIDEGNPEGGGACSTGEPGICSAGTSVCQGGSLECVQDVTASEELCDGLDNDCDGVSDEGNPGGNVSCDTGISGVCEAGTTICVSGSLLCEQDVTASVELCDGLDNDCDGVIDEGNPEGGGACSTGEPGICSAGISVCQDGSLECVQDVTASVEVCDGLDNDCDGAVDEGNPEGGGACSTGEPGVCSAGTSVCQDGSLECAQDATVSVEVCDGLDNDCDGSVDESFITLGDVCSSGTGECLSSGNNVCSGDGSGVICDVVAAAGTVEVCDGLDNDCDGVIDEEDSLGCIDYYFDGDDDSYGLDSTEQCLCAPSGDYAALVVGDCDDDNESVNPDAMEICGNSVDEDCSGNAESCPVGDLQGHLETLAGLIGSRSIYQPDKLLEAQNYIEQEFASMGLEVRLQEYEVEGESTANVIAHSPSFDPSSPALILGAHFDTAHAIPDIPGADDNASGVAVLLESARLLINHYPDRLENILFVAFSTEELPAFGTQNMGSSVFVRGLDELGYLVESALILEMVGYFDSRPGTQEIPPYIEIEGIPDTGNFLALVADGMSAGLADRILVGYNDSSSQVPALSLVFAEPNQSELQLIRQSDNISFWDVGIPALVITDTAFLRNPNYHENTDTLDTLSIPSMEDLTQGLAHAVGVY